MTVSVMHPARQRRLLRGWEPVQLIGRLRIEAAKDGVTLPKTYLLVRLLFLWENHRIPLPGYYAGLIARVLGDVSTGTRSAA
ncbi:hypothetical protein GCM10029963_51250 [Micromonospora andamanensis]|uniref:hypothetical protein n=1 Tax=Micromonospora andamanensis TaxID=1287068 RepID=UPI0019523126|nr:hypothetical protein [Micromonospora andamanensis]GIJ37556.1 hypothetical protein Vwe01_08810 [Micromonospora andamanensis]